ncbi:MAG: hypothetical protein RSA57_03695 [Cetobacterium sp.]|uniref:transcriptional regulator n=1 Tax=Bacteria TaxID=2 RepID=UPI002FC9C640
MDIAKKIKIILATEDLNISDLAIKLNTSPQNVGSKLKRNNFSIKEMLEIANVLGYDLSIEFTKRD